MSQLIVRPYRPEDLARLELQPAQRWDMAAIDDPIALSAGGEAWSLVAVAGGVERVRACGGLLYYTKARARAWTLIGRDMTRREWAKASIKMGARLTLLQAEHGLRRVEAETPLAFAAGHRLLVHLGFRFEACEPFAGPRGETYCLYARYADRAHLPVRYDQLRALGYRTLVEDAISPQPARRAA